MALSTYGEGRTWVCPVYFAYDESLNLFFKSMPTSRHMGYIKAKPEVATAIYSTQPLPTGDVVGIQLSGEATILSEEEEISRACRYYYGRQQPQAKYTNFVREHLSPSAKWQMTMIVPSELCYFDTRFFDEENQGRQQVPLDLLGKRR